MFMPVDITTEVMHITMDLAGGEDIQRKDW